MTDTGVAAVTEQRIDGLRWLVVRGSRTAVFRALGEGARDQIAAVVAMLAPSLRRHVATPAASMVFEAVRSECQQHQPLAWAELVALAEGADVPFDDLLLVNLRGDLGEAATGAGCSDLAWRGSRTLLGHNEDGDVGLDGHCALVTLHLDGEPAVTAFWYPGFLPSNAFAATGNGLVWGIDHVPIPQPAAAPGRHFVARALQRCRDLDEAVALLTANPSAGGFAYTIGELATGRAVTVEAAAGRSAVAEAGGDRLLWHTNHLRYLELPSTVASNSEQRGRVLADFDVATSAPDVAAFLRVLTHAAVPHGVHRDGGADATAGFTLCTFVTDLTAAEVTVVPAGATPTTLGFADLIAGTKQ